MPIFGVVALSFVHWTHGIEDTNTLSWMYIFIYLLPLTHRHGVQGNTHGLLNADKWQKGRCVYKRLHGKGNCGSLKVVTSASCKKCGVPLLRWYQRVPLFYITIKGVDWDVKQRSSDSMQPDT